MTQSETFEQLLATMLTKTAGQAEVELAAVREQIRQLHIQEERLCAVIAQADLANGSLQTFFAALAASNLTVALPLLPLPPATVVESARLDDLVPDDGIAQVQLDEQSSLAPQQEETLMAESSAITSAFMLAHPEVSEHTLRITNAYAELRRGGEQITARGLYRQAWNDQAIEEMTVGEVLGTDSTTKLIHDINASYKYSSTRNDLVEAFVVLRKVELTDEVRLVLGIDAEQLEELIDILKLAPLLDAN